MSISLGVGNKVQEITLSLEPGFYEKEVPTDMEVLDIGIKDKELVLFVTTKFADGNVQKKTFLVHPSKVKLPEQKGKFAVYYYYLGTIPKLGLHVFEIV